MKSKILLLAITTIFCNEISAQTLSPSVISSSGGFYSNGTAMLSTTVGEMTMVETFSPSAILTQGFQQWEDFNVSVNDLNHQGSEIALGPNPTQGQVQMIFSSLVAARLTITIFDITGKIIYKTETEKSVNNNYVSLNLSSLACGDYILDCQSSGSATDLPESFSQKITLLK